ncbi:AraC-type DNA-binding protein [Chitinophaga sp. YR573]|uniref:helix-turn-helix transcriptional regulator n=1 Tax=Chitinophaga sp. YR573 TaxID=1881040 RepID=UPI0008CF6642|nr:AraC family transcriptional regulator [Chitinophaga sp. YR573]SEW28405.1 AraC-type DNA-binding protein [Chitinophaga sp. YR573]
MDKLLAESEPGLIASVASILNTSMDNNGRMIIPAQFGHGYLQAFNFNPGLRMMVRDYELKESLLIKKKTSHCFTESVFLLFQNSFLPDSKLLSSVQVFPEHVDAAILFPGITVFKSIVIAVKVAYLKELLKGDWGNEILAAITKPDQPYLFEVLIPPSIDKITKEILEANVPVALRNFYFKVKAEELIYLLFAELFQRENMSVAALNIADIQTIYKIRNSLLTRLDTPPVVSELALQANFSKSKLTRLFRQIFGTGIFQYYQAFRMQEAARLLKAKRLSVSEVGYQMGFINLSHFSRTFEKYIGMKPKKYTQINNR